MCFAGHINQGNKLTAWVDASQVYGFEITLTNRLRDPDTSERRKGTREGARGGP